MLIGLTGPTGAGKTSVSRFWERLGARIIDCDKLYHAELGSNPALNAAIAELFPEAAENGRVCRVRLGQLVFSSPERLCALTAVTNPFMSAKVTELAASEPDAVWVCDAVALFESGIAELCDATVCVIADTAVRRERITRRDSLSDERASLRLSAQKDDAFFTERAGHTLINNGDELNLQDAAEQLYSVITGSAPPAL